MNDGQPLSLPVPVGSRLSAADEASVLTDAAACQAQVGSLVSIMLATRPDLAFACHLFSRLSARQVVEHQSL